MNKCTISKRSKPTISLKEIYLDIPIFSLSQNTLNHVPSTSPLFLRVKTPRPSFHHPSHSVHPVQMQQTDRQGRYSPSNQPYASSTSCSQIMLHPYTAISLRFPKSSANTSKTTNPPQPRVVIHRWLEGSVSAPPISFSSFHTESPRKTSNYYRDRQ